MLFYYYYYYKANFNIIINKYLNLNLKIQI